MMGSIFAGTEESPVRPLFMRAENLKDTAVWEALLPWHRSSDRYFQDVEDDIKKFVPEGIEGRVATKLFKRGSAQFTGGLRAGMGYAAPKQ
jgi:IMP dehydrogenase